MDPHHDTSPAKSNQTMMAVLGSAVLALLITLVLLGNPFRAIGDAYIDQGAITPASGAPAASTTAAPAAQK